MSTVPGDDQVGGALVTGTPFYFGLKGRMEENKPSQFVLEQGLEVDPIWTCVVRPPIASIRENDQVEITFPPEHPYLGLHFRVRGVQRASLHPRDARGFLSLTLSRVGESR
jgi:hypothetical protein